MSTIGATSGVGRSRNVAGVKKKGLCIATTNIIISRLGGALLRNARELPGPQTIMRGLHRFHDIAIGFRLGKGKGIDALLIGLFNRKGGPAIGTKRTTGPPLPSRNAAGTPAKTG